MLKKSGALVLGSVLGSGTFRRQGLVTGLEISLDFKLNLQIFCRICDVNSIFLDDSICDLAVHTQHLQSSTPLHLSASNHGAESPKDKLDPVHGPPLSCQSPKTAPPLMDHAEQSPKSAPVFRMTADTDSGLVPAILVETMQVLLWFSLFYWYR
jgi:hypothetical protein